MKIKRWTSKLAMGMLFLVSGAASSTWVVPPLELQGRCYGVFYVTSQHLELRSRFIQCLHMRYRMTTRSPIATEKGYDRVQSFELLGPLAENCLLRYIEIGSDDGDKTGRSIFGHESRERRKSYLSGVEQDNVWSCAAYVAPPSHRARLLSYSPICRNDACKQAKD